MANRKHTFVTRLVFFGLIGFVSFAAFAAEANTASSGAATPSTTLRTAEAGSPEVAATPSRRLVISLSDRKLALLEGGELRRTWDIAVGKAATPSPIGVFEVSTRAKNPTWYGPKQTIPPGPKNPVGTRWIGLSKKGYGIHGTNAPESIGTAASRGCIRMHTDDVEELFELVQAGDKVELVAKPEGELLAVFRPTASTPGNETKPDSQEAGELVLVASAKR